MIMIMTATMTMIARMAMINKGLVIIMVIKKIMTKLKRNV